MATIADMPRTTDTQTESVSARLPVALANELREIGKSSGFKLTMTALIEAAVREYVEARRREQPDAKRVKR
jgi:hypothetical protein